MQVNEHPPHKFNQLPKPERHEDHHETEQHLEELFKPIEHPGPHHAALRRLVADSRAARTT